MVISSPAGRECVGDVTPLAKSFNTSTKDLSDLVATVSCKRCHTRQKLGAPVFKNTPVTPSLMSYVPRKECYCSTGYFAFNIGDICYIDLF